MALSLDRWKGKVAVVTGASAGIGSGITKQLVQHGLIVVGLSRRKEKMDKLAKDLQNQPGKFYSVKADVTKEEDIINAFDWIRANLGAVHILINNAGCRTNTNLIDGDTSKWKQLMDTNVLGLCIATREAIKDMKINQIDGHIVHINSIAGHTTYNTPQLNLYPASKFAVTALTETLRQELRSVGSKIKITSISPGIVKTEVRIAAGLINDKDSFYDHTPHLNVDDIANAVVYVLSTPPHVQVHELIIKPIGELI